MLKRILASAALLGGFSLGMTMIGIGAEGIAKKPSAPRKKVVVELYTSQGCDSCPSASDLLGRLAALGYGPDRIVPVGFHVDYFNDPWPDPYGDPSYSRRQLEYNEVQHRDDLYFTPLMMVDGKYPLLGSDRRRALAAIDRALKEAPGVSLAVKWKGSGPSKTLEIAIADPTPDLIDKDLVVGVALTEGPTSTRVPAGENAGKTLVEHNVVRSFLQDGVKVGESGPASLSVPLSLKRGQRAERTSVAVFVQDRTTGAIYQAESIPWTPAAR